MVASRVSVFGVLGLCEKSHACIAARERAIGSVASVQTRGWRRRERVGLLSIVVEGIVLFP